jgi:thiol-disulfide isomerase/thioredoxin
MPPAGTEQPAATPTFYPAPEAEIIYPSTGSYPDAAYLGPDASLNTEQYPPPDPYLSPDPYLYPEPYPGPADQVESPAYPGSEEENPGPAPYPGPEENDSRNVLEPTRPVERGVITTPTPFPILVQKTIPATDPESVKLDSGRVQFIMFFAYWDGISKAMAPVIFLLQEEFMDRMDFVFLDIDNPATRGLKKELKYKYQPEYFLVDEKGMVLKKWSGFIAEEELRSEFLKAFSE